MKGQVSIEFIVYLGAMFVILALVLFVSLNQSGEIYAENVNNEAKNIAFILSEEINIAARVGDGYSHRLFVPDRLFGNTDYSIETFPSLQAIRVRWQDRSFVSQVITSNISGSYDFAWNAVKNDGGMIVIE